MPPKKRRKRDHPVVEHWTALSGISKNLAALCKQEQQFRALLKQIATLSNHDAFIKDLPADVPPQSPWEENFKYSAAMVEQIKSYIDWWIDTLLEDRKESRKVRDKALKTLKETNVSDDDALKEGACLLAEAEAQTNSIETVIKRWCKIVRFQQPLDKLKEHTNEWLKRWLDQWNFADKSIKKRVTQFKETYSALESIF